MSLGVESMPIARMISATESLSNSSGVVVMKQSFTPPLDFPEFDGAGWGPRTLLTS
jgi:hypothetical protein